LLILAALLPTGMRPLADGSFGSNVSYKKYGAFTQVTKTFFDEKLKLFGSIGGIATHTSPLSLHHGWLRFTRQTKTITSGSLSKTVTVFHRCLKHYHT
jgi:hypothetical protein